MYYSKALFLLWNIILRKERSKVAWYYLCQGKQLQKNTINLIVLLGFLSKYRIMILASFLILSLTASFI